MEPLPMLPSCSLSEHERREQIARYRAIGAGAELVEWRKRHRTVRIDRSVRDALVEQLVAVERSCCPFFELSWDLASRHLTISVSRRDDEAALDAVSNALGIAHPTVV